MNEYGEVARRYWREHLPGRYAAISDPEGYFTELGAQVSHEAAELWGQMTARQGNPPGEDYLERVGRLNAVRKQAEEIVLADLVFLPPEQGTGDPGAEPGE